MVYKENFLNTSRIFKIEAYFMSHSLSWYVGKDIPFTIHNVWCEINQNSDSLSKHVEIWSLYFCPYSGLCLGNHYQFDPFHHKPIFWVYNYNCHWLMVPNKFMNNQPNTKPPHMIIYAVVKLGLAKSWTWQGGGLTTGRVCHQLRLLVQILR